MQLSREPLSPLDYTAELRRASAEFFTAQTLDRLQRVADLVRLCARSRGTLWIAGNGGSASTAEHAACDFGKSGYDAKGDTIAPLHVSSLTANTATLSALANDISVLEMFAQQLRWQAVPTRDMLLTISASGSSGNIVELLDTAGALEIQSVGFFGCYGDNVVNDTLYNFYVPSYHCGVIEDIHLTMVHILTDLLKVAQA